MNKIKLLVLAGCCLAAFASCETKTEKAPLVGEGELVFTPVIADNESTRAWGNDFFETGDQIYVDITSVNSNTYDGEYIYTYGNDGIFRGNPNYRFTLDDNYVTDLTAVWPHKQTTPGSIILDQREYEDHRKADWLAATASIEGVMPTGAPVPLTFNRENALLEFEIVGQNTEGLSIDTLLLELNIGGVKSACWAYCGYGDGHAYLILEAGTIISSSDQYLIGLLTVNATDKYYIVFPSTNLTLEKGTRYLVTLTPEGYDMTAVVYIWGWQQSEGGIGIPFQQPTPNIDGTFNIDTPQQLIAMSYLIRHYDNPASFDWRSRTYIISDDLIITNEFADEYIPVPLSIFGGQILQNGQSITSLSYGEGSTLQLIDTQN